MSQQGRPVETVLAGEAGAAAAFSGMHDSIILLVAAFAAARSLPLQKAKLDADSLAISAMAVLWGLVCIFESYRAYRGELLAAKVLLPLAAGLAASLLPRSRTAIGLSYTVVFAVWLVLKVPFSWDSEYWQAQTDATVVCTLTLLKAAPFVPMISTTVRLQMAVFYLGAGFWKINTSFLDPASSCASIYIAQLLDVLGMESALPTAARTAAVHAGPLLTIVGELSIGLLLLVPRRSWAKLGVALALLLHLGIALTPPPNNIAEYGTMSALRLAWLFPHAVATAMAEPGWLAVHAGSGALLLAVLAARGPLFVWGGLDGWRAHLAASDEPLGDLLGGLDLPAGLYGFACSLFLRALVLDKGPPVEKVQKGRLKFRRARGPRLLLGTLFVVTAVWYAFGTIVMGVLDVSSPNMFSNVRMQGGSNHLLLPTALLQKWHRDHGATSAYSGGVVRVESTNSTLFLSTHPSELTPVLRPAAVSYLVDAGHSGRQWNAAVAQVIGAFAVPPNPAASGGAFVRYTIPAFAVRELVRRARASGEAFELIYEQLYGAGGDEEWRTASAGRRVKLHEDGAGGRSCVVAVPGSSGTVWEDCAKEELVLQGPPSAWEPLNWLGYGQSFNSYVVDAPKGGELHCYGS